MPVGFAIVPGLDDISEGLVISDVPNDVGETGNQFVWIPVSESTYKRNATFEGTEYSQKYAFTDSYYLPSSIQAGVQDKIDKACPTASQSLERVLGGFLKVLNVSMF